MRLIIEDNDLVSLVPGMRKNRGSLVQCLRIRLISLCKDHNLKLNVRGSVGYRVVLLTKLFCGGCLVMQARPSGSRWGWLGLACEAK